MTWPTGIDIASIAMTSITNVEMLKTDGLHLSSGMGTSQKFKFRVRTVPLTIPQQKAFIGFLVALNGPGGKFNLPLPGWGESSGTLDPSKGKANWYMPSFANAGDTDLTLGSLPNNQNDVFVTGDLISFQSSKKIHVITETGQINANSSGTAVFDIFPPLTRNSPGLIRYSDVTAFVKLTGNVQKWRMDGSSGPLVQFELECLEA